MINLTSEKRFVVLASIVDLGGAATKSHTLDNIETMQYLLLDQLDLQEREKRKELVWRNDLAYVRRNLVDLGYVDGDELDNWAINHSGIAYLLDLCRDIVNTDSGGFGFSKLTSNAVNHAKGLIELLDGVSSLRTMQSKINILPQRNHIDSSLLVEQGKQVTQGDFDPKNLQDARKRVFASVVRRQGQPAFRQKLLLVYGGQCAITGANAEPALEAAHILPYRGIHTNHPSNGLLLRSDIHTLFDLRLIAIDTATMTVIISPGLMATSYHSLEGTKLNLPANTSDWPNAAVLNIQRQEAGL